MNLEGTVRVDPFLDDGLASRVRAVLEAAVGSLLDLVVVGAGSGFSQRSEPPAVPVLVVPSPDSLPRDEADHIAFVASLISTGADIVVLATLSPAGATAGPGYWPAYWVDCFAQRGWRFCDIVRPALWDDPALGPDAKEGWLVFVAPGVLPQLRASPPLALVHPHRLTAVVAPVQAQVEELRERFLERLAPLAHRTELDVLSERMAETTRLTEGQRQRTSAQDARLAAVEHRLTLLLDTFAAERLVQARTALAPPATSSRPPTWMSPLRRVGRYVTGQNDRRTPSGQAAAPPVVDAAVIGLFDEAYYVERNPAATDAPLAHYLTEGERLGRRPNPWFDPIYYAEQNADVMQSGMNLLTHYARFGGGEGRPASVEFDSEWYATTHPEVRRSGLNPLLHFMLVGASLGYRPSPEPDPLAELELDDGEAGSPR